MFILSFYYFDNPSGEEYDRKEFDNIEDAVEEYTNYSKAFEKVNKLYGVLLYTESGNIIYGF